MRVLLPLMYLSLYAWECVCVGVRVGVCVACTSKLNMLFY